MFGMCNTTETLARGGSSGFETPRDPLEASKTTQTVQLSQGSTTMILGALIDILSVTSAQGCQGTFTVFCYWALFLYHL
jgi:hypothetical protein